jgi:hypothetical protein
MGAVYQIVLSVMSQPAYGCQHSLSIMIAKGIFQELSLLKINVSIYA